MITEVLQTVVDAPVQTLALEQKFAATTALTGVAPSLSSAPFGPFAIFTDGIWRYKQINDPTKDEADAGGLFTLGHKQPVILEQLFVSLGTVSVAWTVKITTSPADTTVMSGTGTVVIEQPKWILMPGENLKITCAATTGKPWIRVYLRADQARRA